MGDSKVSVGTCNELFGVRWNCVDVTLLIIGPLCNLPIDTYLL